jgi:hypothetical protein
MNALRTAAAAFTLNAQHDVTVSLGPVVSVSEVDDFERRFSITLPPGLGVLLTQVAGSIEITSEYWHLPPPMQPALRGVHLADFKLDLGILSESLSRWSRDSRWWEEAFAINPDSTHPAPISQSEFLPFIDIGNGDHIGIVHAGPRRGHVYYLDHEYGSMNWARLGRSFEEFVRVWFRLGCVGDDYDDFEPFYDADSDALSLEVPESQAWIRFFGLDGQPPGPVAVPVQFQVFDESLIRNADLTCQGDRNFGELVTSSGQVAMRVRNAFVWGFKERVAPISMRDRYGIIDTRGNLLVEPRFEFISDFEDGIARARDLDHIDCWINCKGERLPPVERAWYD